MSRPFRNRNSVKPTRRLRTLAVFAVTVCVAAGITGAATGSTTGSDVTKIDPILVQKLQGSARGSVAVSTEKSTSYASFIKAGLNGDLMPGEASKSPGAKAGAFLRDFGALLGVSSVLDLQERATVTDKLGATHVLYEQVYKGVPVWSTAVRLHLDKNNNLTAVNGVVIPDINLDTNARLSAAQAAERAIAAVRRDPPVSRFGGMSDVADLRADSSKLYVYRMGLVRGIPGTNQLAYEVVVTNGRNIRDVVIVHAHAGKLLNRYSTTNDALFRRLFESFPPVQVWQEGDPFPGSLNGDQQNIVNFSGNSYYHFFNAFGRDSYDAAGHEMQSVNNDPRIACPNANWNGITTNYCNGVTSDDVVAHEWGHAYTQFTHNLIYQWQPGALNESYSDIWGELVDQINGAGTDTPGPVRTVDTCSTHTAGRPLLTINSPPAIAGDCPTAGAAFGPSFPSAGLTGNVVLALDGTGPGDTSTENGCTPLTNAAAVSGNIALIYRGACTFVTKVVNAEAAGAVAVIIANNVPGAAPFTMSGTDPGLITPSAMTTFEHGNLIKGQLPLGPVNVTIRDTAGPREDSYRWLMGEDATAFGAPGRHAIRDMWSPTCLSDPGKVTDAEYHCDPSDGGGVHTNSGVPNHAFALLVDGGTYNGHTVASIGLVKAAHLYWRAQSVYQGPASDFDDHANALEASCADLVAAGTNLEGLSTSSTPAGPSGQVMTASDCAAVTEVIAAVEFRTDPTDQCNFTPLLDKNPPAVCGDATPRQIYRENFEGNAFAGWKQTSSGVYSGWPGIGWQRDTTLPGGDTGTAAFAPDPDAGNCDQNGGDISGSMLLASPVIRIPGDASSVLRLKFEHYVATEFEFDGGNVKISINGGAYALVPTEAFLFNPYNVEELQPTNPLAPEPGFSGTDGGQVTGSWGQSHIDLSALGVNPGDRIRVRFDFGIDGCAGIDGWYVDDITVWSCRPSAASDGVDQVASHRH